MIYWAGEILPCSQKITAGKVGGKKAKKRTAPAALFSFLPLRVKFHFPMGITGQLSLFRLLRGFLGILRGSGYCPL